MKLAELIKTGPKQTDLFEQPFLIAEAGVNHEGSMDLAKRLIDEAKKGGADAIKFQSYKAETLAVKNSPAYWDTNHEPTKSQFELFKKYDKFWKSEFEALKRYCDEVGIEFLSTPFDIESANFLEPLMGVYKVSSSDLNNKLFIDHIARKQKPVLLSTGASLIGEIRETVSWLRDSRVPYSLMHCVLNYPTPDEHANLAAISTLQQEFPGTLIGYSDHTLPKDMRSLEIASLLGARILEKHFTHDKTLPGNDHYHAMDFTDVLLFRSNMARVASLLGSSAIAERENETSARNNARRSLVSAREIKKGRTIEISDLTFKRPASGIGPQNYQMVLGRTAIVDIPEDTPLQWEMFNQ